MIENEVEMRAGTATITTSVTIVAVGNEITVLMALVVRSNLPSDETMRLVKRQLRRLLLLRLQVLLLLQSRREKCGISMLRRLLQWRLPRSFHCPVCSLAQC